MNIFVIIYFLISLRAFFCQQVENECLSIWVVGDIPIFQEGAPGTLSPPAANMPGRAGLGFQMLWSQMHKIILWIRKG